VAMTLQEAKLFAPRGSMPSHIYCYDKRFFAAVAAAVGSAPAFRPENNVTQFDDFVDTLAPFARVAMALKDATPVPARLRPPTLAGNAQVVAMKTAWGGVVTVVFTARPGGGAGELRYAGGGGGGGRQQQPRTSSCPATVSVDLSWLPRSTGSSSISFQELSMLDPGPTCGGTPPSTALPGAFRLLPPPRAFVAGTPPRVTWAVHCVSPGETTFATMLVVKSVEGEGAAHFVSVAVGQ
jgi:hypothetical protein